MILTIKLKVVLITSECYTESHIPTINHIGFCLFLPNPTSPWNARLRYLFHHSFFFNNKGGKDTLNLLNTRKNCRQEKGKINKTKQIYNSNRSTKQERNFSKRVDGITWTQKLAFASISATNSWITWTDIEGLLLRICQEKYKHFSLFSKTKGLQQLVGQILL